MNRNLAVFFRCLIFLFLVAALMACSDESSPPAGKSAASSAPAPPQPIHPFNGTDLSGWTFDGYLQFNKWTVGAAALDPAKEKTLVVTPGGPGGSELISPGFIGANILTEQKFADARIELEFMIPAKSNSGVFVMGEYEVQILDDDDPEKTPANMKQGAIVRAVEPRSVVTRPPGKWQKYEIDFRAPRFDDAGNKTANAKFVKIVLNGEVIHENVELEGPTPGGLTGAEVAEGPLLLQGAEGAVAFRNIVITPVK